MLRASLVLAAALGCFSFATLAQPPGPEKKPEPGKVTEETGKSKGIEPAKGKTPEKLKLPKDAIVVVVDDFLEAMGLFPKMMYLSVDEYNDLKEKLKTLERQLKSDRKTPFSCKLHGKLEGDFLHFRAEYAFSTELPRSTVLLGLKGGHLLDAGDLEGQEPILDYTEEGFIVKIQTEGNHQLTLNFRVPVEARKPATGAIERGIELGLPGAAVTILDLKLPGNVKELRWNENIEKAKTPGQWLIGLEKSKNLSLAWKEPAPLSGNTPLAKAEGQITVRIDETHVNIAAELFLEDLRPQTKEWQLLLPAQAKVTEVKTPNGLPHPWTNPEPGGAAYTKIADLAPGRWQVSIVQRVPRPNAGVRIPVGPYHVLGAFQHHGVITVQMPPEVSFGQRLVFARAGEIYQVKNAETEAEFKYVAPPIMNLKTAQAMKAPLELEWRNEKSQLETRVDHALKLKTHHQGWELETTTRIKVNALFAAFNSVELNLPIYRPRDVSMIGVSLLGAAPDSPFPGALPWGGLWKNVNAPWASVGADEFLAHDEIGNKLKLVPQDGTGRVRVISERSPAKQMTIVLKKSIPIPGQELRVRIELPRPLNTQDRGAKLTIQSDERVELLYGPPGAEEPVPERTSFDLSWDQAPSLVDIAWRAFERDVVAQATIDVTLFENTAQVRQTLKFPKDRQRATGFELKHAEVALKVPHGMDKVTVLAGADGATHDASRQLLRVRPRVTNLDTIELELEYDLPLTRKKEDAARWLALEPVWPTHASQKDVKVRVWSAVGLRARMADPGIWKERSIELVNGKDQFPVLVLHGYGANLPLILKIEEPASAPLAAFLADRALMQIRMTDEDSQQCKARYWVRRAHASHVEIELPLPIARLRDVTFSIGKVPIFANQDGAEKVIRLALHPELITYPAILEINYTIPADGMDRNYFWRTTLLAPSFRSQVVIGQTRWQFSTPTPMLAAALNRKIRPDWQWALQGWLLTPEPAVTNIELDSWFLGKDSPQGPEHVTFSFAHNSAQPETVYHLPRAWWLLGCSGLWLMVTLGAYLSALPRPLFWGLLLVMALAVLALEIIWPAAVPPLLFGLQPGVVLLVVFISVYWVLQERYRRQLVFLPGFTRTKANSTVVRTNVAKRPRETSTLDAPTPPAGEPSTPPATSAGA
jgi:hypothetical protein